MKKIPKTTWIAVGEASTTPVEDKRRPEVSVPLPACWLEDYEKNVIVNPTGRYSESYNSAGVSNNLNVGLRKYKVLVPLKTGIKITVEVHFKLISKLTLTGTDAERATAKAAAFDQAKKRLKKGIVDNWNSSFKLEVEDPLCGKKYLIFFTRLFG
jgi:type VI secretion system secreted protein VgrG